VESKPPVLAISKAPTVSTFQTKMQWSEAVDISKPMDDFEERVPDMAFKYKFELDTFQKQVSSSIFTNSFFVTLLKLSITSHSIFGLGHCSIGRA